jgi:hypothetical protein
MTFRNVILCHIVPGSEPIVGDVFDYYDRTTRPQDLGVIGRTLLSYDDLYIHIIERREDPAVSGQRRGLPAFQQIAEAIAPYVTPYPSYWQNPSDSVAKEFYRWVPDGEKPADAELTVIVQRIKPGAEHDVARIFAESDAGPLPAQLGVTGRWLYLIDDVFVHLLEQDTSVAETTRGNHGDQPALAKIIEDLGPYVSPYRPDAAPQERTAKAFYRWRAQD